MPIGPDVGLGQRAGVGSVRPVDSLERHSDLVRELMSVSPDDFIERRDALVRRLRDDGAREAASEIAGLRRPSPALWAANQIGRRAPEVTRELLTSGQVLREAQSRMLAGEEGVELTTPAEDHRKAVLKALDAGREALRDAGRPATDAMVERLRETLVGASLAEGSRGPLADGRLMAEVPAASIGFVAQADEAPRSSRVERRAREKALEASLRAKHERERARREAEENLKEGERRRDDAFERVQMIREEREHLERAHADALRRQAESARALADAEAAVRRMGDEAAAAEREVARTEERAGGARANEETAQRDLDEAREAVERARRRMRTIDRERET